MLKSLLLLLFTLGVLAGCGQVAVFGHTLGEERVRSESPPVSRKAVSNPAGEPTSKATAQAPSRPGAQRVNAVTLALTPRATAKVASDPRFKADELLHAVEGELRSRELFDAQDPRASGTAEILIDDFATRSTSNAVVFGYSFVAGTLTGDIRVRDAKGNELRSFRVAAESRLTVPASGEDANALGVLYRRFATLAADSVAGTP